ncbi:MAG: hypothetical protein HC840_27655 [Leptolyngbyaceae cyanobacterium RM2_2_4]|nr:hypothetical protein [Leptolyngbyaceae cyanobacterium RM2_2_4]
MAVEEVNNFKAPCVLFLGILPYTDFMRQMQAQVRYAVGQSAQVGINITKFVTCAGDIEIKVVKPLEHGDDLVMMTDDPSDLERHSWYKHNKEADEAICEALGIDESTIHRRSTFKN